MISISLKSDTHGWPATPPWYWCHTLILLLLLTKCLQGHFSLTIKWTRMHCVDHTLFGWHWQSAQCTMTFINTLQMIRANLFLFTHVQLHSLHWGSLGLNKNRISEPWFWSNLHCCKWGVTPLNSRVTRVYICHLWLGFIYGIHPGIRYKIISCKKWWQLKLSW